MKDNQNKEIIINDTPIIPLGNTNKDVNENTLKVGNNTLNKNEDNNIDLNLIQPDQTNISNIKNLNNTCENIFNDNTSVFDSSKISENIESKDINYIFDNSDTNIISQNNATQEINSSNENNISFDATMPLNNTISNIEVNNTYDNQSNTTQDSVSNTESNLSLDNPLHFDDIQSNGETNNTYVNQNSTTQDSVSNTESNISLDNPLHLDNIQNNGEANNTYDSQSNTSQDSVSNIENNINLDTPLHLDNIQNNGKTNNTYVNQSSTTQDSVSNIESNISLDTPLHLDNIQNNGEANNTYDSQSNTSQDSVSNIENNINLDTPLHLDDIQNNGEANNTYDSQSNTSQDSVSNIESNINLDNSLHLDDIQSNGEANNTYVNQSSTIEESISDNNEKKTELNDNNIIIENKDTINPEKNLQDQINLNNLENTVTLGTSENNKKEEKKTIFSKIKNIMNKTMLIIFLVVIIGIIIGTVIYFITTAKNKEKRLNNIVNIFIEKSNIGDLENIIGFVDNIANGNIPKAANYINEEYNFKISLNSNIENIENLGNYNYSLLVLPQDNYKKYQLTVSDNINPYYLININGTLYNNNNYYRFNGLSDPNTYVRTPETTEGFNLLFPNNLEDISLTTNYNNMLNKIKEIYSQKEFETSSEEININENSYKVYKDSISFTKEEVTNIIKEFTNGLLEIDTNNIYDLKLDFYTNKKDNKPLKIDVNFNENLITILFINDSFKVYNYDNTNKSEFNINESVISLFYNLKSENNYNCSISYSHTNDELVLSLNGTFNDKELSLNIKGRKDNITEIPSLDIENSINITEFNNPNFMINLIPTPFYKSMYQYN